MGSNQHAVALVARQIHKNFGTLKAVDGVSLTLEKGKCLALLGPNGAGKTTTCEMLEGLIAPDVGEIKIFDMDFKHHRLEILERIGVQLQETNLYKRYTVKETLQLFASFYQKSSDITAVMQKLDLVEKADAKLMQLSGGQKQRVYLGCALINNPDLLFLDEPTTGLDPQARRNIWEKVEELKKEGRSILLTTHYMEEAERLADVVAIMDAGRVIAEGSPKDLILKYSPGERVSLTLSKEHESAASLKSALSNRLPEFGGATINEGGTFELMVINVSEFLQKMVRATDELKIAIQTLAVRPGSLEDVFIKLTGRSMRDD